MARVDLHTHTHFSPDGRMTPQVLVERAGASGLTHVAVTDHQTTAGAIIARRYAEQTSTSVRVIVGEEIASREAEILGLFLRETVPSGRSAAETVAAVHAQGGVAVAAHPFDRLRPNLGAQALAALRADLDAIEGYNGRTLWRRFDAAARGYASEHELPLSLGSDAHSGWEMGRSWLQLPAFDGPQELIRALRDGTPHLAPPAPWLLAGSGLAWAGWWRRRGRLSRGGAA